MRKSTGTEGLTGLAELGPLGVQTWYDEPLLFHRGPAYDAPDVDDIDAWARHAQALNGFADAIDVVPPRAERPDSHALHRMAHAQRFLMLGRLVAAAARGLRVLVGNAIERYRRHRQARAAYEALRQLDDRVLRDLGLDRSELASVAAEVAGEAEYSRVRGAAHY